MEAAPTEDTEEAKTPRNHSEIYLTNVAITVITRKAGVTNRLQNHIRKPMALMKTVGAGHNRRSHTWETLSAPLCGAGSSTQT